VLRAWVAFDRGGDPFPILDAATESGLSRRYIAEHRALLLLASNRPDEGVAALRAALGADPGSIDLRWNAASLLAGIGDRRAARDILAGEDATMTGLRDGLVAARPGAAFGTSRLLTRLAADLQGQETQTLAILLTRSALSLDPGDDRARLLLAAALGEEGALDRAQLVLGTIRPDSPFYSAAVAERIELRRKQGDPVQALALAQALATAKGASVRDIRRYADLLSAGAGGRRGQLDPPPSAWRRAGAIGGLGRGATSSAQGGGAGAGRAGGAQLSGLCAGRTWRESDGGGRAA
jgi:predicted Zn-dependent protease